MTPVKIARWESRSGKHFAELYRDELGYTYRGNNCGGNLGAIPEAQAIDEMEKRVRASYFQPDANQTPMRRTT